MKTHGIVLILVLIIGMSSYAQVWQQVGPLNILGSRPRIEMDGGIPFLAFADESASDKLSVMSFDGNSWNYVGAQGFADVANPLASVMDVNNGVPYIVTQNSSSQIVVYNFNGMSWVQYGTEVTSVPAYSPTISVDNGVVYVAFREGGPSISVKKYEAGVWSLVGSANFSGPTNTFVLKVVDGTPYVLFEDADSFGRATVMYFDNSSWVTLGQAEFSADAISGHIDMVVEAGEVFVSYSDQAENDKMSVMKFDGTTWNYIGVQGFTPTNASHTRLALRNGNLFACYLKPGSGITSYVMRFDGTLWQEIGSFLGASLPDVATYETVPYITYLNTSDDRIYVEKFDFGVGLDESKGDQFKLYPNPSYNKVTIRSEVLIDSYELFDSNGSILIKGTGNTIDLSSIDSGVYLVRIYSDKGLAIRQVIKD